ncbi:MAG: hypothetical protein ACW99A_04725 [Candidatus Kariarchaeaceae archaeon]|jgi:hypothetical protein
MEESELSSYFTEEDDLLLRKNFSFFVSNVEIELQRYGVQATQSEILGYIMEKLTDKFLKRTELMEGHNIPIDASEGEIARYIINRKYPFMTRFDDENTGLNQFQKFMRRTRFNHLSDSTAIRMLRMSQLINIMFFVFAGFLGLQSLFSLVVIYSSDLELAESFLLLDGDLIYGYELFWTPEMILYIGGFFIFNTLQTYFVLNIPTLGRIKPKLNDYYSRTLLRMRFNLVLAYSHILYMLLGSIIIIEEERVNGYEPVVDLGIPIVFALFCTLFGAIMWVQFRKEKIKTINHHRSRMRYRALFYLSDMLFLMLSLILLIFLGLVILSDSISILNAANDDELPETVDHNEGALNLVTFVILNLYLLIFMISSLINHSHDKDKWIKFINIQMLFQAVFVVLYTIVKYYIINQFNLHMELIEEDLRISFEGLREGATRYFISMILSFSFLRLSK